MNKEISRNTRLGIMVLVGTAAIVAALYFIGSEQHLFGSTVKLTAQFNNVNGLRRGNSVRFTGIDIGTVESIEITSDTTVLVRMVVDEDILRFMRKNAVAVIGTDGVMGNKLVNINPSPGRSGLIEDGDWIRTIRVVEMDATMRTLNSTSENINAISGDLRAISEKLNSERSLLNLLLDQSIADNVRASVAQFRITGENTAIATGDLRQITQSIRAGNGIAGLLLTDTSSQQQVFRTIVNVRSLSDSVAILSGNFNEISANLKNGNGTLGVLLSDTTYAWQLEQVLENLEQGTDNFNTNMLTLQKKWPFKEKKKKKRAAD